MLAFILSCSFVVGNAEDAADNKAAADAASVSSEIQEMMSILRLFEIIPEYYDYNVPIASEVTRADFAAAVARLIGMNVYGGADVYFYDVPKTHWAYNEISNLAELGVINGSSNKMFEPDIAITKGEAYKILLSVMGYDIYAENNGGFPTGYLMIANRIGVADGVSNNENILMSDMFYLIYNAMKTDIMESSISGEDIIYEAKEGESLLSLYRDVYYEKGVVRGANTITVDNGTLDEGDVLIDDVSYKSGSVDMFEYIGQEIEFFYYQDSFDDKTILWATGKDADDTLNINVDNGASFDEKTFYYTYYTDAGKKRTIKLDKGITLIYNGGIVESGYDDILNGNRYSLKLVKNKDEYSVAVVKEYENYVVGSVGAADFRIYDKINPKASIVLDEDLYDTFRIKMSGLTDIKFDDIKQGYVLSVFESKDKRHMEVVASNNTVIGSIKGISEDTDWYNILINETSYRMDKAVYDSSFSSGDDIKAYLDVFGNIAYMESMDSKFKGAFLIDVYYNEAFDEEVRIKHLAEDGNITVSECAEKVVIDGKRFKDPDDIKTALIAGESEFESQFALIKKNADGKITGVDTVAYNENYETTASLAIDDPFESAASKSIKVAADTSRIGYKIIFDTDSIIFSIPEDNYKEANPADFTVLPATAIVNDTSVAAAQSYKTTEDGGISKYILVKNYDSTTNNFEHPIIVKSIETGVDEENCVVEVLNGYQGNIAVSIHADSNHSNLFSQSGALPGTLVKLGKNNRGKVIKCDVLYDYRTGSIDKNYEKPDRLCVFGGYVHNVVGDVLRIGKENGEAFDYAFRIGTVPVMIYDTKAQRNPIYTGSIGDAITYKNDPAECSKIIVLTWKMQTRMFLIYK